MANRFLRGLLATVGLIVTAMFWFVVGVFEIRLLDAGHPLVVLVNPSLGGGEIHPWIGAFGLLVIAMIIYGRGIHWWRRFDDYLRQANPNSLNADKQRL
jgi:hypothetical protein